MSQNGPKSPKIAPLGTIYHTLLKTSLPPHGSRCSQVIQRLRDFGEFAKRNGMDAFGTEMSRRGLEHWWIDVNR